MPILGRKPSSKIDAKKAALAHWEHVFRIARTPTRVQYVQGKITKIQQEIEEMEARRAESLAGYLR